MPRQRNFWIYFLLDVGPSWQLLTAFLLGLLVISVLGNLAFVSVWAPETASPDGYARALGFATAGTLMAYVFYRWDRRRPPPTLEPHFTEGEPPPGYPGLIWLLGPGNFEHLVTAIKHHASNGGAHHCWLLMQDGNAAVQHTFAQVNQRLVDDQLKTKLHPVYLPQLDVQNAFRAVRTIFDRESLEAEMAANEVIADITGGTKPMTAGMVLAALSTGGALEYVNSRHDENGRPLEGTAHVVQVDISFYMTRAA